jgi:O-antigen/teichoic acid export membrane protein
VEQHPEGSAPDRSLVVLVAGTVSSLVPQLSAQAETLRILAVAFPLLTVNAVELHVRSGRGRNREVLRANTITLLVNVPLSIGLIVSFGLPGAAAALAVSELLQAVLLWCSAVGAERAIVGVSLLNASVGAIALVGVTAAIANGLPALAGVGAVSLVALVTWGLPRQRHRPVAAT